MNFACWKAFERKTQTLVVMIRRGWFIIYLTVLIKLARLAVAGNFEVLYET